MTKVIYNGKVIELKDELEEGERELDLMTEEIEENVNAENINLEDTMELDLKLDDTLNLSEELYNYDEWKR